MPVRLVKTLRPSSRRQTDVLQCRTKAPLTHRYRDGNGYWCAYFARVDHIDHKRARAHTHIPLGRCCSMCSVRFHLPFARFRQLLMCVCVCVRCLAVASPQRRGRARSLDSSPFCHYRNNDVGTKFCHLSERCSTKHGIFSVMPTMYDFCRPRKKRAAK